MGEIQKFLYLLRLQTQLGLFGAFNRLPYFQEQFEQVFRLGLLVALGGKYYVVILLGLKGAVLVLVYGVRQRVFFPMLGSEGFEGYVSVKHPPRGFCQ